MTEQGTHIRFVDVTHLSTPRKTQVWEVRDIYEEACLGSIKWFPRWRKYAYFPDYDTVYEEVCMREISEFIERKTKEHKKK